MPKTKRLGSGMSHNTCNKAICEIEMRSILFFRVSKMIKVYSTHIARLSSPLFVDLWMGC